MQRDIPNTNEIKMYLHCRQCLESGSRGKYAVGWTELGLQVWCETHEANMMHVDFEGQQHPANQTRKKDVDTDKESGRDPKNRH